MTIYQAIGSQIWSLEVDRIDGKIAYFRPHSRLCEQKEVAFPLSNQCFISEQEAKDFLLKENRNKREWHLNEANRLDKVIKNLESERT